MLAISRQYSYGADKAVQISQAVYFDKGTQPELRHKNCKITLLIWIIIYQIFIMNGSFGFKLSEIFDIALLPILTQQIFFCLEILTFKMVFKVSV